MLRGSGGEILPGCPSHRQLRFPDFPILSKFSANFCPAKKFKSPLTVEKQALKLTLGPYSLFGIRLAK
jgi:hypothetical protein